MLADRRQCRAVSRVLRQMPFSGLLCSPALPWCLWKGLLETTRETKGIALRPVASLSQVACHTSLWGLATSIYLSLCLQTGAMHPALSLLFGADFNFKGACVLLPLCWCFWTQTLALRCMREWSQPVLFLSLASALIFPRAYLEPKGVFLYGWSLFCQLPLFVPVWNHSGEEFGKSPGCLPRIPWFISHVIGSFLRGAFTFWPPSYF